MQFVQNSMWPSPQEATFSVLLCRSPTLPTQRTVRSHLAIARRMTKEEGGTMFSSLASRRGFASRRAGLIPGIAASGAAARAESPQADSSVKKLNYEGKPAGTGFITPLIIHSGVIYVAGQGAYSHDPEGKFPMDIETHTKK